MDFEALTREDHEKIKNYLTFLRGIFISSNVDPLFLKSCFEKKYEDIWISSITHKTKNYNKNYDSLEFDGDASTYVLLDEYISKLYTNITPAEVTNIMQAWNSKIPQSAISDRIGFPSYAIMGDLTLMTVSIKEDLLESFFGAVLEVGNRITKGCGERIVKPIFYHILKDEDIKKADLNAKAFVIQTFQKLHWGDYPDKPQEVVRIVREKRGNDIITRIISSNKSRAEYRKYFQDCLPTVIGEGFGKSQKVSEMNAFKSASDLIKVRNIDDAFIRSVMNSGESIKQKSEWTKADELKFKAYLEFIKSFLTTMFDSKLAKYALKDEYIQMWKQTIIETSKNLDEDNRLFNIYGTHILKLCMAVYFQKYYYDSEIIASEKTLAWINLLNEFPKLSSKFGFSEFSIQGEEAEDNNHIIQSFSAVLYKITNQYDNNCGQKYVQKIFEHIIDGVEIDFEKNPKTRVNQYFQKFNLKMPRLVIKDDKFIVVADVMPDEMKTDKKILAIGDSEQDAYVKAAEIMEAHGINDAYLNRRKNDTTKFGAISERFKEKVKKQFKGYENDIFFEKIDFGTIDNTSLKLIYGRNKEGHVKKIFESRESLDTIRGFDTSDEEHLYLMRKFLSC